MTPTNLLRHRSTRREVLAAIAAGFVALPENKQAFATPRPVPVPLAESLRVVDYRVFPTDDVMRFIVEVENLSDQPIDSPAVGVVQTHSTSLQNYGFAVPNSPVLLPQSSVSLMGVAPEGIASDSDWGELSWHLCSDVTSTRYQEIANLDIAWSYETQLIDPERIDIFVHATNLADEMSGPFSLTGDVLDADNRFCGIFGPAPFPGGGMYAESSAELRLEVSSRIDYFGSPFYLVEDVKDLKFRMQLQPPLRFQNVECPVVMPWNRTRSQ